MLAGGSLPINRVAMQLFGCMHVTRLHARGSLRCHATCILHACKLRAAVQWNRCAVMRLNRCAVMRVKLWERFEMVRQTRGVDILSELVVGVCPEESYGIVLGESLSFARATLLVELDPVGGCAWDEN